MGINRLQANIDGESVIAFNARDLWESLECKEMFRRWIKRKITRGNFKEGIDFIIEEVPAQSVPRKEYIVSYKMAKWLAAYTHTAKRIETIVSIHCPKIEEEKKEEIMSTINPGNPKDNSVPKAKKRRAYYSLPLDGDIATVLIERKEEPGVFDEFKCEPVSVIGDNGGNE